VFVSRAASLTSAKFRQQGFVGISKGSASEQYASRVVSLEPE
jgi:hypothetical protein